MTIRLNSLKKITELKNKLTMQANWEYTESRRALEAEQNKLQNLIDDHDRTLVELHAITTERVSAQELHDWMRYMDSQRVRIEKQSTVIGQVAQACDEKREAMTDRFKDEQIWNRLQDRRVLEHRAHLEKLGQEALDEIAVTGRHKRG